MLTPYCRHKHTHTILGIVIAIIVFAALVCGILCLTFTPSKFKGGGHQYGGDLTPIQRNIATLFSLCDKQKQNQPDKQPQQNQPDKQPQQNQPDKQPQQNQPGKQQDRAQRVDNKTKHNRPKPQQNQPGKQQQQNQPGKQQQQNQPGNQQDRAQRVDNKTKHNRPKPQQNQPGKQQQQITPATSPYEQPQQSQNKWQESQGFFTFEDILK